MSSGYLFKGESRRLMAFMVANCLHLTRTNPEKENLLKRSYSPFDKRTSFSVCPKEGCLEKRQLLKFNFYYRLYVKKEL